MTVTPLNQNAEVSLTAKFTATVEGVGPFTYKWQKGIHIIRNKIQSTFIINEVSVKDTGYYRCLVTNSYGNSALSNRAFLQVTSELYCINVAMYIRTYNYFVL